MAAAQDGTVYAVALAYWDVYRYTVSRDPDYLVALKGSSFSNLAEDMVWVPLTATSRMNTNIMADQKYYHLCAVSDDQTQFILHTKPADNWVWDRYPRTFSTRIILSGPHSNNTVNPTMIMTVDWPNVTANQVVYPWAMASVQDLASANTTDDSSISSTTTPLFAEWVRFSTNFHGADCMQSISGAFSQLPRPVYFTALLVTPFTSFNSSSPTPFPPSLTSTQKIVIQNITACDSQSTAMTVQGSVAYIVCISSLYPAPCFIQVNILTGSISQVRITFANKAIAKKNWMDETMTPSLVAVSNQSFIYTDSLELPRLYYSIDMNGNMDNYTLGNVQLFSSNNLNPDWWNSPLTLSTASSVMVSILTFLLAVLLIWAYEKLLKRRRSTWIDDADVPGSKVAEEMDDEAFWAYQRDEQVRVRHRDVQKESSSGRSPDQNPLAPHANVFVSSPFETSYTTTAVASSRDFLRERHSGPLREQLGLSNHPRPNVVTTIPDEESDDLSSFRLPSAPVEPSAPELPTLYHC
ncbi:hypothetical protein EMPS_05232 [Entomortierella parvispora]|uniref:Transmembrane protein n=1 Tax=Entomortierella parvispora TaxID=205924 RepID=A0A9P3HA23_9FUNG|nr:hypothetical protein EMPS_05232 [Entomortierella parvispora]